MEFVVLFSLARDLLLSILYPISHQMTTFFTQNDEDFTKMISLFSQYSFWMRKVVIWWLFNDNLRARGREPHKEKEQQIPCLILPHHLYYNSLSLRILNLYSGVALSQERVIIMRVWYLMTSNFGTKWKYLSRYLAALTREFFEDSLL